eukprot:2797430-Amphidinium_carterae.1
MDGLHLLASGMNPRKKLPATLSSAVHAPSVSVALTEQRKLVPFAPSGGLYTHIVIHRWA